MTIRNVIEVIVVALLFLATGTAHAETLKQYCEGHWTDPRKEYEDCVTIRQLMDANHINRAEDACVYLFSKADAAYTRCLDQLREPRCDLACQLGIDDIDKKLPRGAGERIRGNLPVNDIVILPPKEFDRDYPGEMTIRRADERGMREACLGISITGCTYRWNDDRCVVYIANDDVLNKHYLSYDGVFRHERAHCLGWHHADESKRRY